MKPSHHLAPWALMLSLLVIGCEDILNPKSDDTTPPTIKLTCNTHNGIAFFELQLAAEVNDNKEVKSVDFVVNDSVVYHATSEPWSTTWIPEPSIIDTSFLVLAIVADQAGNTTLSDTLPVQFSRRTLDITRSEGGSDSDHWGWNFGDYVWFGLFHLTNRYTDPVSWSITQDNKIMLGFQPEKGVLQPDEQISVCVDARRENYRSVGWHSSFVEIASDPGTSHTQKVSLNVTEILPLETWVLGSGNYEQGMKLLYPNPDTVLVVGGTTGIMEGYFPSGVLVASIDVIDHIAQQHWITIDQFEGMSGLHVRDAWLTEDQDLITAVSVHRFGTDTDSEYLLCATLTGELIWWQEIDGQVLAVDRRSDGLIAIACSVDQSISKILYAWEDGSSSHEVEIPVSLGFDLHFYRDDQILISGSGTLRCQSVSTGAALWDFDDDGSDDFRGNRYIAIDDLDNIYLASLIYFHVGPAFSVYKISESQVFWRTGVGVQDQNIRCILPAPDGTLFIGANNVIWEYGIVYTVNPDGSTGYEPTYSFDGSISGINYLGWNSAEDALLIIGWSEDYMPTINNGYSDIIYHTLVPSEF